MGINVRLVPNKKALNKYIYLHFTTEVKQGTGSDSPHFPSCRQCWTEQFRLAGIYFKMQMFLLVLVTLLISLTNFFFCQHFFTDKNETITTNNQHYITSLVLVLFALNTRIGQLLTAQATDRKASKKKNCTDTNSLVKKSDCD